MTIELGVDFRRHIEAIQAMAKQPGVFLDRDGTVIEERHFLSRPEDVVLLPTAGEAIARLNSLGIPVAIVTNQSGIALLDDFSPKVRSRKFTPDSTNFLRLMRESTATNTARIIRTKESVLTGSTATAVNPSQEC